ncbi:MAG TPA: hypothetical protein VF081_08935 [Solirubrobacterales bacterium]
MGVALVVAVGGCGDDSSTGSQADDVPQAVIKLGSVPGLGKVLINSDNQTIYRSSLDIRTSGTTACNGPCARVWQPVLTGPKPIAGPGGIEQFKLDTIKRQDGTSQVTYDGWPLYTYTREGPRQSKGLGISSFESGWYALQGAKAISVEGK